MGNGKKKFEMAGFRNNQFSVKYENNDYTTDNSASMSSHKLTRIHIKCNVCSVVLCLSIKLDKFERVTGVEFRLVLGLGKQRSVRNSGKLKT